MRVISEELDVLKLTLKALPLRVVDRPRKLHSLRMILNADAVSTLISGPPRSAKLGTEVPNTHLEISNCEDTVEFTSTVTDDAVIRALLLVKLDLRNIREELVTVDVEISSTALVRLPKSQSMT